jgi:hypothetical protein
MKTKPIDKNYIVYSDGRVYSVRRKMFLNPATLKNGYSRVLLHTVNGKKNYSVHRLVAEAFIPNPNKLPAVNHKNGIKTDNRVENLEWCNNRDNSVHYYKKFNKLTGVGKTRNNRFESRIVINRRLTYLGRYDTDEEAHQKYLRAKLLIESGETDIEKIKGC